MTRIVPENINDYLAQQIPQYIDFSLASIPKGPEQNTATGSIQKRQSTENYVLPNVKRIRLESEENTEQFADGAFEQMLQLSQKLNDQLITVKDGYEKMKESYKLLLNEHKTLKSEKKNEAALKIISEENEDLKQTNLMLVGKSNKLQMMIDELKKENSELKAKSTNQNEKKNGTYPCENCDKPVGKIIYCSLDCLEVVM